MNNLIRLMNRLGRGYSFEALRAKVLFNDRLHTQRRPPYRRQSDLTMNDLMTSRYAAAFSLHVAEEWRSINYGVDIALLTRLLEDRML